MTITTLTDDELAHWYAELDKGTIPVGDDADAAYDLVIDTIPAELYDRLDGHSYARLSEHALALVIEDRENNAGPDNDDWIHYAYLRQAGLYGVDEALHR